MSFTLVSLSAMLVMGAELKTTYKDYKCYSDIPAFWGEQFQKNTFAQIPNQTNPGTIIGLYTNYSPNFSLTGGQYSFIIGTQVSNANNIPSGMVIKELPASKYAVFTAKGPFDKAVGQVWTEIWQNKEIDRTFTGDFELYDSRSTNDENSIIEIYVAIK